MKDQRKIDTKAGFQVNTKPRELTINEEAKNAKQGGKEVEKLRTRKPHSAKSFMKPVWKTHEITRA